MNTLLIVEDEKMIRQGIISMITRSSVKIRNIIECKNGQEALDIIKTQVVDVMITDIRMPKMDGITLVKEMQKCDHIPLTVVISGYEDFSYAVELLRHGVKEYLLKPIERPQIIHILEKLDGEIRERMERQSRILNIELQQLRYLMMCKEIPQGEKATLQKIFEHLFSNNNYIVCCTNYDYDDVPDWRGLVYLRDVDKNGVFILEESKANELLTEKFATYCIGQSRPHQGFEKLREAYMQAVTARKQAFATGEHIVVYDEDYNQYESLEEQKLNQIVQLLGTSKISEAVKEIDHIYYKLKIHKISTDIFCEGMRDLLNKVITTYKNAIIINDNEAVLYREIETYHSAIEFCSDLKKWFEKLNAELMKEFDDYSNKQKIQQAVLYINENYNKELNMAVVSNYISMNYSLFSYIFKVYTGYNFVNYLKNIRVREAKRLLETTEMMVSEVALAVGYESDKHFMKTFKSICGVSPTEYRRNAFIGRKRCVNQGEK